MTRGRLANWHEDAWLSRRLAQPAGQAVLLLAVALLVPASDRVAIVLAVALTMAVPARRVEVLAAAGLWVLHQRLPDAVTAAGPLAIAIGGASVLAMFAVVFAVVRRFDRLPAVVRRSPVAVLHGVLLGALAICTWSALRGYGGAVWGAGFAAMAVLIPFLLWRASYLVLSGRRGSARGTRAVDHVAWWFPLWGGTSTPYGKGYDYLREHRVDEPLALARCRAAGVKLLLLAVLWNWVHGRLDALGSEAGLVLPPALGGKAFVIPALDAAIAAGPGEYGLAARWLIILLELFRSVAGIAARGHVIVGVLRLLGFQVFRNTYKPLLAPTILEFWNRYYYYFKELMVEFFFYPTFVALSKRRAAVRIVLSVLAAATVGNLYYHVVQDHLLFLRAGMDKGAQHLGGRAIYSVILGAGVAVSMLRERQARGRAAVSPAPWARVRRVRAILGVWCFYGLLHIWNVGRHTLDIDQRMAFLLGMFGVH